MRNILVTGGTVFVSRYAANYFSQKGDHVFVLNRNSRPQLQGVTLIEGDRNHLGNKLKNYHFDAVLDITAYTRTDAENLVSALGEIDQYIFISSSAVYPETLPQPFCEDQACGPNAIWGSYGTNKLEAEKYLLQTVPQAYILRPPYLYGPMQNVYREPFVFDCAEQNRPFYLPKNPQMPLQFFHVEDLCRFMEILLQKQPADHIFNVGNPDIVTVEEWVKLCYETAESPLCTIQADASYPQRSYFCFHDYGYRLDVTKQMALMPDTKPLAQGLRESYVWYQKHRNDVNKKPYLEYIDSMTGPKNSFTDFS